MEVKFTIKAETEDIPIEFNIALEVPDKYVVTATELARIASVILSGAKRIKEELNAGNKPDSSGK